MKKFGLFSVLVVVCAVFCGSEAFGRDKKERRQAKESTGEQAFIAVDSIGAGKVFSEKVLGAFERFYERGGQEKVFLHTDKPYYCAGEKLWFRGYVVDAMTLQRSQRSGLLYVELLDPEGEVVETARVGCDSLGVFDNNIVLDPEKIAAGEYTLRAYTRWMTNEGPELFFSKKLRIDELNKKVINRVSWAKNDDGTVTLTSAFLNGDAAPIAGARVSYSFVYGGERARAVAARTDDRGEIGITFRPEEGDPRGRLDLYLEREGGDLHRKDRISLIFRRF